MLTDRVVFRATLEECVVSHVVSQSWSVIELEVVELQQILFEDITTEIENQRAFWIKDLDSIPYFLSLSIFLGSK